MTLSNTQLSEMASILADLGTVGHPIYPKHDCITIQFDGLVIAKERPRHNKFGTYTPKKTRDFEDAVKRLAMTAMQNNGVERYSRPVNAHLTIYESIPQSWGKYKKHLALQGLLLPNKRDLDNQEKAIMDALNGICFVDDCQISQKFTMRRFGEEGFTLHLSPMGISYSEGITLENIIKQRGK